MISRSGSGSTDFVVGTSAFYRSGRWFGTGDVQYAIRRTGDFDYRFGNDLQWTLSGGRYWCSSMPARCRCS